MIVVAVAVVAAAPVAAVVRPQKLEFTPQALQNSLQIRGCNGTRKQSDKVSVSIRFPVWEGLLMLWLSLGRSRLR